MLHEFLTTNRVALIDRCRLMVAGRNAPRATGRELEHGIPLFLDQLIKTLRVEQTCEPKLSRKVSGLAGGGPPGASEIGATATLHGRELSKHGYTVDQVVHDYGDLCQAITELAAEKGTYIDAHEFGVLNIKLDNAIACAVTEYARRSRADDADSHVTLSASLHELRNLLNTSIVALTAMRNGTVGLGGATSLALDNSLQRTGAVLDRAISLADANSCPPARSPRALAVS